MRSDATWASNACAERWAREHPGERRPGRGSPHIVDTRSRSGRQVSYRKLHDAIDVTFLLRAVSCSRDAHEAGVWLAARGLALDLLQEALPERQRQQKGRAA